jgi:hypothetical protein
VLEPVEHLLQRELHSSENGPVALRDFIRAGASSSERKDGCASGDQEGKVCDNQPQTKKAANGTARYKENAASPDAPRPTLMDVRVEPYHHARGINRHDRGRDLSCIY